ncbi:MAG: DnaJ C-terminal domain-containing protein, partial [Actinomycetota bacterium]
DQKTRGDYDRFREMLQSGFVGTSGGRRIRVEDLGDLFSQAGFRSSIQDLFGEELFGTIFGRAAGGPPRRADLITELTLPFEEATRGTTATLQLNEPGTGRPRSVRVRIPAGVKDGDRIRVPGKGAASGGPPGDLYVEVTVKAHPLFGRKDKDLTLRLPVTFAEAALGGEVEVPTLNGSPVRLKIPSGTQPGKTFRIRGRGAGPKEAAGDLLVTVEVVVPSRLSTRSKDLLRQFAQSHEDSSVREHLSAAIRKSRGR